ncbi:unnamed protein product, partial [Litomosoides sigmodontis]
MALKALGGFILILNENGDIYYVSKNIETYLGFHQSDILHQSLFEMIHSEDREDIKSQLAWNYNVPLNVTSLQDILAPGGMPYLERNVNARFRCLLDNTCGFLRIDVRGKLMSLHGLPHSYVLNRIGSHSSGNVVLGLVAICCPFVSPNSADEQQMDEPILKTKHSLDFMLIFTDSRMKALLELDEKNLPQSFYSLVYADDVTCVAEAHKEVLKNSASGILIYRLISIRSERVYWIQSSCRTFYKNGTASLSLYVTGPEKNRCSTLKRHYTQFSTPPPSVRSKQPLSIPMNRNLSTQATAEFEREQHLSTRGRKRKKQISNVNADHPSISPKLQYSTCMMPSTKNDLKVTRIIQNIDGGEEQVIAATTAPASISATRVTTNCEDFTTATASIHEMSGTSTLIREGLFQFPQDLTGLSTYFTADNNIGAVRNDQSYQWSSSTKANHWPSSSELYYQNYTANNVDNDAATISSGFYSSQMDGNSLEPARNHRVEYPALFIPRNLTST